MKIMNKILFPTDFSPASLRTAKEASVWADKLNATLEFFHVVDIQSVYASYADTVSYFPDLEAKLIESAKANMREFVEKAMHAQKTAYTTAVETGAAAETICEYAKKSAATLVLMATHGRKGFKHLVLGSVAEKVVRLSDVPVLTMRLE